MKERIDVLLVNNGFFEDIDKARRAVMAGIVLVNDVKVEKAGTQIKIDDDKEVNIRIKGKSFKYVSRGGLKLEKAIKVFELDFAGKKILDVGSSTGGFTDCALINGAEHVYAVDVGTNQLDWKLRNDKRVTSLENKHIRDLTKEEIDNSEIDFIVMDVSFISITNIFNSLKKFFKNDTKLMALIKPQFEVEKSMIDKGGIVRDKKNQEYAVKRVIEEAEKHGLYLEKLDFSPIKGGKGNCEYISLFGLEKDKKKKDIDLCIGKIIDSCENLGGAL